MNEGRWGGAKERVGPSQVALVTRNRERDEEKERSKEEQRSKSEERKSKKVRDERAERRRERRMVRAN